MISGENAGKFMVEGKFPCAVYRKNVSRNSILYQFYKCQVYKRCSGIRGKLKEDSKFKYQTCANQQTGIVQVCPDIQLNSQSLEILEKFCCYLGDKKRAKGSQLTVF